LREHDLFAKTGIRFPDHAVRCLANHLIAAIHSKANSGNELKVFAMAVWISALLVIWFFAAPLRCFGQEAEEFPDSSLTPEQWQQRIEEACRRSEEFVANARTRPEGPITPAQEETEAADRALNDPTLHQGDVISTGKGFVVFVGRDEEHRPGDFLWAPNRQPPR
jgi:hypothetical protein